MNSITEAQKKAIRTICFALHIDLKEWQIKDMSRQDAFIFIRDHKKIYNEAIRRHNEIMRERRAERRKTYYSDNVYAGPYGSDIVDCFDMGIFPWGDS